MFRKLIVVLSLKSSASIYPVEIVIYGSCFDSDLLNVSDLCLLWFPSIFNCPLTRSLCNNHITKHPTTPHLMSWVWPNQSYTVKRMLYHDATMVANSEKPLANIVLSKSRLTKIFVSTICEMSHPTLIALAPNLCRLLSILHSGFTLHNQDSPFKYMELSMEC